jgi:serine/threonine-protein kinase
MADEGLPKGKVGKAVKTTVAEISLEELRQEQPAALPACDLSDFLLDVTQSVGSTQLLGNLAAGLSPPTSKATGDHRPSDEAVADGRPTHHAGDRLCRQQVSSWDGQERFRPFNDRYRIAEEVGSGGMGSVFLGWDRQLQREVAIKVIREDLRGKKRQLHRFLREARIASQLSHPGVLGIHDFGVDPSGSAYIIMDLITGQTMEQAIEETTDIESKRESMLTTFYQICQAMAFAHANGVIHRDLKPANIMVGDYGLATVLDWGLAKVLSPAALQADDFVDERCVPVAQPSTDEPGHQSEGSFDTVFGTVMGTPYYLAPEQARGEVVDYRADVFSLGGILCHLLTGHPPFWKEKLVDVFQQSFHGDLSFAFNQLDRCGAPIFVVRLAKRCLDPNAQNRPENAGYLVAALKEYLESGQRRAEEELVRFFDLSLDMFCIANTQGYFWRLNDNFTRTLGYSAHELTSQPFIEFVHPDDRPDTLNEILKLSRGVPTIRFINRYRHRDGHYISLEWTARSLETEGVIYAVARDISERIRLETERACIESDRLRLSEIVDSASDAIIGKGLDGVVQSWNLGAEKLFGYTAAEMIGERIHTIIPPDRLGEEVEILERVRRGERIAHFETVRIDKFGERIDISLSVSPIRDRSGAIIGASKIARSITKQRDLESELETSRKLLIDFAENANVPLHCVDRTGTILWANEAELNFLGYAREEYVGQPIAKFHANQETIEDIFCQLIAGKSLFDYRARLVAKDGSMKDVAIYSNTLREDGQMVHTRCFTVDLGIPRRGDPQTVLG